MAKYPLLEQLRAEREREEEEICAPVYAALVDASRSISVLRKEMRLLEAVLRDPIIKYVSEEVGSELARVLLKGIREALMKYRPSDAFITLHVPSDVVRAMGDPQSIEKAVMDTFRQTLPQTRLGVEPRLTMNGTVTVLRVTVPEMHVERHLLTN